MYIVHILNHTCWAIDPTRRSLILPWPCCRHRRVMLRLPCFLRSFIVPMTLQIHVQVKSWKCSKGDVLIVQYQITTKRIGDEQMVDIYQTARRPGDFLARYSLGCHAKLLYGKCCVTSCRLNPQYLPIKISLHGKFVTFLFLARFPNAYVCIRRLITLRTGSKAQEHRLDEGKKSKQYKTKQIFLISAMEEDLDDLRVLG